MTTHSQIRQAIRRSPFTMFATVAPVAGAFVSKGNGRASWYSMTAATADAPAEILIYDEIGAYGISAKAFDRDLKALGEPDKILLRVNSPGGDVFDGVAIFNTLAAHKADITARVDGLAASAASLIIMAADTIEMPNNAFMLIHEPSAFVVGKAADMQAMATDLKKMTDTFIKTYADRSGADAGKIRAILKEDRLMDATEANELGLTDSVTDPIKMVARFDLDRLAIESLNPKVVAKLKATFKPAAESDQEEEEENPEAGERHDPVEGEAAGGARDKAVARGTAGGGGRRPRASGGNVVSLDAARGEGEAQALAYTTEVLELCRVAGKPAMASDFVKNKTAVADVRKALLKARAKDDAGRETHGQHSTPATQGDAKASWKKTTDRLNAEISGFRR